MGSLVEQTKGNLTFENVLMMAMNVPGVKIDRRVFLKKELIKYCREDVVDMAIKENPAKAGISKDVINKISKSVIDYETTKVTTASVIASLPSSINFGVAIGASTADIVVYFTHIIRVVQELAYLYGFGQFDFVEDNVDSDTMKQLMLFMGVMFGVQGASTALKQFADVVAKQVSKKLSQKALMKGTVYPIIKKIAAIIGIRMTRQIFADTVASAIPLAGSALSGGLTYAMFQPRCMKLRRNLMKYNISDPDYYRVVDVQEAEEVEET